jgi:ubiquinone/menaquinone biosynthesis C-methylase UbiE
VRVRRKGLFYVPGWLYDAALGTALRGLRRRVAAAVAAGSLFPCLDVCCGTGSQLRASERLFRADGNGNDNGGARGRGLVIGLDSHFGMIRYASARAGVRRPAWVPERTGSDGTGATAVGTLPATSAPLPAGSGSIFVVGDALRLPFKDASFRGVTISFGLHDKSPEDRMAIAREARRILAPGGKAILVDFENPWNARSRLGLCWSMPSSGRPAAPTTGTAAYSWPEEACGLFFARPDSRKSRAATSRRARSLSSRAAYAIK